MNNNNVALLLYSRVQEDPDLSLKYLKICSKYGNTVSSFHIFTQSFLDDKTNITKIDSRAKKGFTFNVYNLISKSN